MKKELMLYLHVPFCVRKCHYCDFLSFPGDDETKEAYVKALCHEIRERGRELSGRTVPSIFFGGGTPSLLLPAQMERIMQAIRSEFYVADDAEITMECNPGTTTKESLTAYRSLGINRLSIGLQSASEKELRLLGRIHDYEDFLRTYGQAREVGFSNVNVDLMSALPGQTLATWQETLEKVLNLSVCPEHVSAYSLIMEEGTKFQEWLSEGRFQGQLALPSEEDDRDTYAYTGERLRQAGLMQYEISNYAKPGFECRHNMGYWTRKEYLGLGLGAASLLDENRYANVTDLRFYLEDPLAGRTRQVLTRKDQIEEFLFLGLRTNRGVSRKEFQERFGEKLEKYYGKVIRENVREGLLTDDGASIRLTAKGMDLETYVTAQFLLEEESER